MARGQHGFEGERRDGVGLLPARAADRPEPQAASARSRRLCDQPGQQLAEEHKLLGIAHDIGFVHRQVLDQRLPLWIVGGQPGEPVHIAREIGGRDRREDA
jgi:hypothetical protein